jgi:hypothetical protein
MGEELRYHSPGSLRQWAVSNIARRLLSQLIFAFVGLRNNKEQFIV